MGILRSDRVSGLGGANAINGSVKFSYDQDALIVPPSSDFNLGTADYTIEAWVYPEQEGASLMIYAVGDSDSTAKMGKFYYRSTKKFTYWCQSGVQITSSGTFNMGSWYHVALVNSSGTQTLYVNGVSQGTSTYSGFGGDAFLVEVGKNPSNTGQSMNGYISNLRVQKGKAEYTAAFTPPTTRLEKTPETVLLCCQSPSDVTQEETGKSLVIGKASTADSGPVAARFVPDKGEDHGTTFADNTKFDTLSYMVPPGGRTDQRGRGRGLLMGGAVSPGATNTKQIKYFDIASQGITDDFGQTTVARRSTGSLSSSTRAVMGGGFVAPPSPYTISDVMDYVTIATTANATDFGTMQSTGYAYGTASNETRGLFAGGYRPNNSAVVKTTDLITIASAGNASNFGDLVVARRGFGGLASPTRGIFFGGAPSTKEEIDYVTIATEATALDFGNLTAGGRDNVYGGSSSTRGVMGGGRDPNNVNIIDYITIATKGDATDFGDLLSTNFYNAATSNGSRAVWVGNTTITNTMEYVTIATTGNSIDWGDQNGTVQHSGGACSDSHGGIS